VRFTAIQAEKARYPIVMMCRLLRVSSSGFYAWATRGECQRDIENRALTVQIAALHAESKGRYGYPRIHAALRNCGSKVGRNRVAKLMRQRGLRGRRPRAYRQTTASNPAHEKVGNVLNRNFTPTGANESWAGDITYIPTREGWLYLAIVVDLYSRRIVGWSTSHSLHTALVLTALDSALANRPAPALHHSDRGCQYTSYAFRRRLDLYNVTPSMSRKGNCWDNAVVESTFSSIKLELRDHGVFLTREQARKTLFEYIEGFYNSRRLHSAIGYLSPAQFENEMIKRAA
jgi:putative transposase